VKIENTVIIEASRRRESGAAKTKKAAHRNIWLVISIGHQRIMSKKSAAGWLSGVAAIDMKMTA